MHSYSKYTKIKLFKIGFRLNIYVSSVKGATVVLIWWARTQALLPNGGWQVSSI